MRRLIRIKVRPIRAREFFPVVAAALIAVLLSGCGYHIHTHAALPFTEVKVGLLKNKTLEPKLEDRLDRALTEEFLKQGITISPGAKYTLTGVIHGFDMVGLSEKAGITVEYKVVISADFTLVDSEGKVVGTKKIGSPFIVSFTASEDLGSLVASREVAEEQAMKDIATEIVGALIYR
jgi:outer membrane lipopolysaccharide assembly protein LptE/RlpB